MTKKIMDIERIHATSADILNGTQKTIKKQTVFANDTKRLLVREDVDPLTFTEFPNSTEVILKTDVSFNGFLNVKVFGAEGDGVTDDTAAINAAIQSSSGTIVFFPPGSYIVSSSINLKTGVSLIGVPNKSILTCTGTRLNDVQDSSYITGTADDLEIRGITIDGKGSFSAVAFPNPYGIGDQYGFTNQNRGIYLNQCHNVKIMDCLIKNIEDGIFVACTDWGDPALESQNITINNNKFYNVGKSGIRAFTTRRISITGNKLSGSFGAMANTLALSTSGDGFYCNRLVDFVVSDNIIDDCMRMAIVLEGNDLTPTGSCTGSVVANNVCFNIRGHRGTENNAGIYTERSSSLHPIIFSGNVVHDVEGRGINIAGGILSGGAVYDCDEIGVATSDGTIDGVDIYDCGYGAYLASSGNSDFRTQLRNCTIRACTKGGVYIENGKVGVEISNNWIEDNELFGIYVASASVGYITPVIKNNVFLSTAAAGATSGQLYGILIKAASISNAFSAHFTNNKFVFSGSFTGFDYPANLAVVPAAMAAENPALTYQIYEIGADHKGNFNSKYPTSYNLASSSLAGTVRFLGFRTAAPTTGTWVAGDFFCNSAMASGAPMYFMCISGGTPGTWTKYGWGDIVGDAVTFQSTIEVTGAASFSSRVGIAGAASSASALAHRSTNVVTSGAAQYGQLMQNKFGSDATSIQGLQIGSLTLSLSNTPITLTGTNRGLYVITTVLGALQSMTGDLIGIEVYDQTASSGTNYAIKTGKGHVALGGPLEYFSHGTSNSNRTLSDGQQWEHQTGTMTAPRTWTLKAASSFLPGAVVIISDDSGTVTATNKIIVTAAGADTINGVATYDIKTAYGKLYLISDGVSKWTALINGDPVLNTLTVTDDTIFVGSGSGLPYGGFYGDEIAWSQANAAQNTWYTITSASIASTALNLVTHTSGVITIAKAGIYAVTHSESCSASVANQHILVGLSIDDATPLSRGRVHFDNLGVGDELSISAQTLVSITAGQTIRVKILTSDVSTPTLTVSHINLTAVMVGG